MSIESAASRVSAIQGQLAALQAYSPATPAARPTSAAVSQRVEGGSFAGHLSQALAMHAPATTYRLNKDGIPTDLAAYGNGRVPSSALEQVGSTGHRLWAPAAEQLSQLIEDARRSGVHVAITDSYRSFAAQVDVARRKGLYSQGGLAAVPGTSDHGWGLAVDLDLDAKALTWMRSHASTYGFREDTPREPWHWGFEPTR